MNQLDVSMNTATTVYCAEKDGNLFVSIASKCVKCREVLVARFTKLMRKLILSF